MFLFLSNLIITIIVDNMYKKQNVKLIKTKITK